jgi:fused signal recognition particle receptor
MFRTITLLGVLAALITDVLIVGLRLLNVGVLSANKSLFTDPHVYPALVVCAVLLLLNALAWRERYARLSIMSLSLSLLALASMQMYLGVIVLAVPELPILAVGHLVLGIITLSGLFYLYLRANPLLTKSRQSGAWLARFALLLLLLECALGAWVSINHAGFACTNFPLCTDQWSPIADYQHAFDPQGVFTLPAQIAITWLHRLLALVCFVVLTLVVMQATASKENKIRKSGLILSALLFIEIGLGILGFKLAMPVWVAILHNAIAVLMILPLISIVFYSRYGFVSIPEIKPTEAKPTEIKPTLEKQPVIDSSHLTPVEQFVEPIYVEPQPESLYLRLKSQLKRTRSGLTGLLANLPLVAKDSEDLLEDIEATLLMADLGMDTTTAITNHLRQHLDKQQLQDGETLRTALKQELLNILKPCSTPLHIPKQDKPFVILVVGVNGAGKTTTIGKLAKRLQAQGHSVMLAAGDTFRAAAVEQLQVWGERNHIPVVAQHTGADSASVIYDAVQSAQAKGVDVLIADTAGRLQTKSNLMDELSKVKRIMTKLDDTAPHEVLLVLDAGTGQNALSQAKLFNEAVTLTGMVLTKLDGTAKGGVIFALAKHTGIPIRYIGIGEGIDDLQDFNAEWFVDALFVND